MSQPSARPGPDEETDPTDQHLVHGQSQAEANRSPLYEGADGSQPLDGPARPAPDEGAPPADGTTTQEGPEKATPAWDRETRSADAD